MTRRYSVLVAVVLVCLGAPVAAQTVVRHLEIEERLAERQIESARAAR